MVKREQRDAALGLSSSSGGRRGPSDGRLRVMLAESRICG